MNAARQGGASNEKLCLKGEDDTFDHIGALLQKWENRLTLQSADLCERYVDGKIDIILIVTAADDQDYGCFIRSTPRRIIKSQGSRGASPQVQSSIGTSGVPDGCESAMRALPSEFIECPNGIPCPSLVGLYPMDIGNGSYRQLLYFLLNAGLFKFLFVPSYGKFDRLIDDSLIDDGKFANQVVKRTSQIGLDQTDELPDVFGNAAINSRHYDFVSGLRISFLEKGIGLSGIEGTETGFKLKDVAFGPFNL